VLAGPRARATLSEATDIDLSNAAFPWLSAREAEVAGVKGVRLLRVNYVGELGWELHTPMAGMPVIFDALMAAGRAHGIRLFGTYAMNSLRLEKAYRSWGSELTNEVDMFEADMGRFLRLDKGAFIGREASLARRQQGERMKLVYLAVETDKADCLGNEPVYKAERLVGISTSGSFGHAVKQSLAFAYVDPSLAREGEVFDILLLGERHRAVVIPQPIWDPDNLRPRG
jgi:dimethylglycine dehydrogenase